jgi:hypothetical protein
MLFHLLLSSGDRFLPSQEAIALLNTTQFWIDLGW